MAADTAPASKGAAHDSNSVVIGITLMAVTSLMIPSVDGIAKYLSETHSALFVSFARYAAASVIVLPLAAMRHGRSIFPTEQPGAHVLRTVFLVATMTAYFTSISMIPLATAISAFFIGPIIAMALGVLFLKEPLTRVKIVSLVLGAAGALIIVRPIDGKLDLGLLLALGSGALFALYMIATRLASKNSDPVKTLAFQCVVGTVLLTPQAVVTWSMPSANELWLLLALGGLSVVSHLMSITAFRYAEASTLAPIIYLELLGSVAIGFLVFGDMPGPAVWIGAGAIVLAGIILMRRGGR